MRKNDLVMGGCLVVLGLILLIIKEQDPAVLGKLITMGVVFIAAGCYFLMHAFIADYLPRKEREP